LKADKVVFDEAHFLKMLQERQITTTHVYEVLSAGSVIDDPWLDEYGEWRSMLKRKVAGTRVKVAVALGSEWLTVVTVYEA
jgi:hypothetical protein